jgi:hypothetical protein
MPAGYYQHQGSTFVKRIDGFVGFRGKNNMSARRFMLVLIGRALGGDGDSTVKSDCKSDDRGYDRHEAAQQACRRLDTIRPITSS